MLIIGKDGMQIMGDWANGEFTAANKIAGQHDGCIAGLGPATPYLIQGDVLVFPKATKADAVHAKKLLANVISAPATRLAFSKLKGSIPVWPGSDAGALDACAQQGMPS